MMARKDLAAIVGLPAMAFGCVLCWLTLSAPALAQDATVPSDFRVRLVSSPLIPSPSDTPESVEIAASGQTAYSEMHVRGQLLPAARATLPRAAVARIYKTIRDENFFGLQPLYRDDQVADGDRAEMTVTAGGRTYNVRSVNMRVGAFDRIANAIDRELPPERRVKYNALRPNIDYGSVER
jgi:hypothetical protein